MEPAIISALISAIIGGLGVKLFDSVKEWAKGRKDEAQRLALKLDRMARRVRVLETLLEATRQLALRHGANYDELPREPPDPKQD